jgi:hypothetical protein
LYCLSFSILTIVLSVVFHFDHCIVCRFSFWPLYCLSFFNLRLLVTLWYLQIFLITWLIIAYVKFCVGFIMFCWW